MISISWFSWFTFAAIILDVEVDMLCALLASSNTGSHSKCCQWSILIGEAILKDFKHLHGKLGMGAAPRDSFAITLSKKKRDSFAIHVQKIVINCHSSWLCSLTLVSFLRFLDCCLKCHCCCYFFGLSFYLILILLPHRSLRTWTLLLRLAMGELEWLLIWNY